MAKDYTCWDCGYYGGRHEPTCPRKGYLNPSAPKAPPPAAPARGADTECPCGIHREDCDYHRPSATPKTAPTYEYGAYDLIIESAGDCLQFTLTHPGRIHGVCVKGVIKL
jgi:hypothetical protein